MAHAFQPSHRTPRQATPWRRVRVRRWRRPDDLPSAATLFGAIPSLPRATLSRLTICLIDRLDEIDGDPDLESLRENDENTHDREQELVYE